MARQIKRAERLPDAAPYELLVHLASGGMGSVFIARPRKLGADGLVAIKRAHPHLLEDATFRKMFVSEAKLAMRLATPHVVGVRAVDESDGELLLVMEYVEGGTLGELVASAHKMGVTIPPAVVLRIVIDAALGLHQAHTQLDARGVSIGLVHRDVSPQNILCGIDGRARIVDFGVAKAFDHEGTHTGSDVFKGKLAYMAPEYLLEHVVSPLIDVFGLGVVAWEALVGRRLFKAFTEQETILLITSDAPAPAIPTTGDVTPAVARAIARALAKSPAERCRSAADFASALEGAGVAATRAELAKTVATLMDADLAERRALLRQGLKRAMSGTTKLGWAAGLPPVPPMPTDAAPESVTALRSPTALTPAPPSGDARTLIALPRQSPRDEVSGSAPVTTSKANDDGGSTILRSGASRRWASVAVAALVLLGLGVALHFARVPSSAPVGGELTAAPPRSSDALPPATVSASVSVSAPATAAESGSPSGARSVSPLKAPPRWVPKKDPYAKQR